VAAHGRAAVGWAALTFLGLQLALSLGVERWRPDVRDPEYGIKLAVLRRRLAERPGAPLVLALGSSRTLLGLRPELLGDEGAVVFNFGRTRCGPVQELIDYRRLRAAGARPAAVLIEVTPALLSRWDLGPSGELDRRMSWGDLAVLGRYHHRPAEMYWNWAQARLLPWFAYRFTLLAQYLPAVLPPEGRPGLTWGDVDGAGWLARPEGGDISAEEYRRRVAGVREVFDPLVRDWRPAPEADRALRELLEGCRRDRVPAVLYLMAEGPQFRSWYSAAARARLAAYLEALGREYVVPVIDGRDWVAEEGFEDSHHLRPAGARAFTARFEREVIGPFLRVQNATARRHESGPQVGVAGVSEPPGLSRRSSGEPAGLPRRDKPGGSPQQPQ
jgi:hypothetical protein